MPAQPKYYHARKIDAQRSGLSPTESDIEGVFSVFPCFFEAMRSVSVEETVGHACDVISNTSKYTNSFRSLEIARWQCMRCFTVPEK